MRKQDEPWIQYPFDEMHRCMVCRKTTRSHAFPADTAAGRFVLSDAADPEFAFTVCHTCYTEHTPQEILDDLNARYDEMEARTGTSFTDFDRAITDETEADRIKVFTAERARTVIDGLEQGAVVEINGERSWLLVGQPDEQRVTDTDVIWGVVDYDREGGTNSGGAITTSDKPLDERYMLAYQQDDGLNFEPIETIEVL